jgi:HAD superfamily hydrolase (TIGR01450 family)
MTSLVDAYAAFAVDLDGVIWRGGEIVDGAPAAVDGIRQRGKPLLFITNNGTLLPEDVARRLVDGGVEAHPGEVLTPTVVARSWIEEKSLIGEKVFVLGPGSLGDQLADLVEVVDGEGVSGIAGASMVLVGRDTAFDFARLHAAASAVREGARLVALNRDPTMPVPGGLEPGTGALVAAVEAASGGQAVILGKPESPMMREASRRLGSEDVLMVGDRPSSDVAAAREAGWDAALVLTGVAGDPPYEPPPDYVLASISRILQGARRYQGG